MVTGTFFSVAGVLLSNGMPQPNAWYLSLPLMAILAVLLFTVLPLIGKTTSSHLANNLAGILTGGCAHRLLFLSVSVESNPEGPQLQSIDFALAIRY